MRFSLIILLAACSADPLPSSPDASPDAPGPVGCTPGRVEACPCPGAPSGGMQTCQASGTYGACVCPVGPDAAPPMDVAVDVAAEVGADATPTDTPRDVAVEAADAGVVCPFGTAAACVPGGPTINLQRGVRRSDGTIIHCGQCGTICAADEFCDLCHCAR